MKPNKLSIALLSLLPLVSMANELKATKLAVGQNTTDIVETNRLAVHQSAEQAKEVSLGIEKARIEKQAIENGVAQAREIREAVEEFTVGRGITSSYNCRFIGDTKEQLYKQQATKALSDNHLQAQVAKKGKRSRDAIAERHARHKGLYCGQSEVKNGSCLYSPKMKPLQDTDFGNIMGHQSIREEEEESALDFLRHIIDPVQNTPDDCNSAMCKDMLQKEKEYASLAYGVQSAFLDTIARRKKTDTPMRQLVHAKIEQSPELLSGDNWQIEQGTRLPDGTEVRGGVSGGNGSNEMASDSLAKGYVLFMGDNLAESYYKLNTQENWELRKLDTPKKILDNSKNFEVKMEGTVVISFGYLNMKDTIERTYIMEAIENIKGAMMRHETGFNVIVLGLPEKMASENDWLRQQVVGAGFSYNGSYKSKDNKTPDNIAISDIKGFSI